MDNNVIISSRGKSSTAQSVIVGIAVIIIGILAFIVFVPTLDDTLYKFAGYDEDIAIIIEVCIYAIPIILLAIGVIAIFSGLMFKKVYIDIYKDYVQGTFINGKMGLEESVTIMIKDIVSVSGASGSFKINTVGESYQVTVNNTLKKEILNHLNRAILEAKRNG